MALSGWSIDVEAARSVVTTTKGHFDKIDQLKVDSQGGITDAITATDNLEIGEALSTTNNEYLSVMIGSAEAIGDNICLKMNEAISHYVEGDRRQAEDAQASTAAIPDKDPEADKSNPQARPTPEDQQ
ncbi:DUF6507 family protein [Citricoccus nitrophenolicus]|uniref:DUF6507 family protein n=1 Tax=Citricoccus nitrophenolicus TaxID=863575 RepID=UPI0031EEC823